MIIIRIIEKERKKIKTQVPLERFTIEHYDIIINIRKQM